MRRPETRALRDSSMIRIILAGWERTQKLSLTRVEGEAAGGGCPGPTEFGGLVHGSTRKIEGAKLLLRRVSAAVGNGEDVASICEYIHHGLEDLLDFGYDEACLVVNTVLRNLHSPGGGRRGRRGRRVRRGLRGLRGTLVAHDGAALPI